MESGRRVVLVLDSLSSARSSLRPPPAPPAAPVCNETERGQKSRRSHFPDCGPLAAPPIIATIPNPTVSRRAARRAASRPPRHQDQTRRPEPQSRKVVRQPLEIEQSPSGVRAPLRAPAQTRSKARAQDLRMPRSPPSAHTSRVLLQSYFPLTSNLAAPANPRPGEAKPTRRVTRAAHHPRPALRRS